MSKNLKLKKVIKSFVPEPISCVFRIPYVYFTYSYLGRILGPLKLAMELKKELQNMKVTVIPIINGALCTFIGTKGEGTSGDHPNYSIIKIGQNTEKSPGDTMRLAVTQTLVRNHRLTLV